MLFNRGVRDSYSHLFCNLTWCATSSIGSLPSFGHSWFWRCYFATMVRVQLRSGRYNWPGTSDWLLNIISWFYSCGKSSHSLEAMDQDFTSSRRIMAAATLGFGISPSWTTSFRGTGPQTACNRHGIWQTTSNSLHFFFSFQISSTKIKRSSILSLQHLRESAS